jgi:hypothetical protein
MPNLFSNFKRTTAEDIRAAIPPHITALLASAGIPPGAKIPTERVDAALATQNVTIQRRLAVKAELAHLNLIEL